MKKSYETRLNLSGVVCYKEVTDETTKAITQEPILDAATGAVQTVSKKKVVEGSKPYKEIMEVHTKNGWPMPTIDKQQTFEYVEFESPDEVVPYFVSLGLDPAVASKSCLSLIQRGWAIAQQQEVYAFMDDDESAEVEGSVSVALSAAQPGERKQKDPMAVISKGLKAAGFNITASELTAFLATMQQGTAQ